MLFKFFSRNTIAHRKGKKQSHFPDLNHRNNRNHRNRRNSMHKSKQNRQQQRKDGNKDNRPVPTERSSMTLRFGHQSNSRMGHIINIWYTLYQRLYEPWEAAASSDIYHTIHLQHPLTAARTMKRIHLLCLKSIPSFFPERLNIKKEAMANITPIH